MTDFDKRVKPETCVTDGCINEPQCYIIGGEVVYSPLCASCQQDIEDRQEREFQRQAFRTATEERWREMGIPRLYFEESFMTFEQNHGNALAYEICCEYAERFEAGRTSGGIILLGSTGCGKTHLACSILKAAGTGYLVNQHRLLDDQRALFAKNWENVQGHLERCKIESLLVLDDIGSENAQEPTMMWIRDMMYGIANTRVEEKLPTIVTANTTMQEFTARLGKRVVSRLASNAAIVSITDKDHRTGF